MIKKRDLAKYSLAILSLLSGCSVQINSHRGPPLNSRRLGISKIEIEKIAVVMPFC